MTIELDTQNIHPATELMIEAIGWLHARFAAENVLDLGCGSGILSVLSASVWGAQVLAADISEKAVGDTVKNVAEHGLQRQITAIRSDGFSAPEIAASAPYNLILVNLLAEPIVSWTTDIKHYLSDNGIAALGGILAWQVEGVKDAYKALGFEIVKEFISEPWHLLMVGKNTTITDS